VYEDGELIGGLYGIALGSAFFGESMFSTKSNGSKIALKALCDIAKDKNYKFIDCQVPTPHLQSLGAKLIDRDIFLQELNIAMQSGEEAGNWSNLNWEYKDGR
jgi:leucyl/phenylalanyl-tRNA--protein transferase